VISPERPDSGQVRQALIDGDGISAVTPTLPADIAGAAVVHAEGQYLIPGLMDSHVHLTSIPPSPIRCVLGIRIWWKPTCSRSRVPFCDTGTRQWWT
jgi:hypothetical protein